MSRSPEEPERTTIVIPPEMSEPFNAWCAAMGVGKSKAVCRFMMPNLHLDTGFLQERISRLEKEAELKQIKHDTEMNVLQKEISECRTALENSAALKEASEAERKKLLNIAENYPARFSSRMIFERWICDNADILYKCCFTSADEAYEYVCQNRVKAPVVEKRLEHKIQFVNLFSTNNWLYDTSGYEAWAASEEGIRLLEKCGLDMNKAYELGKICQRKRE